MSQKEKLHALNSLFSPRFSCLLYLISSVTVWGLVIHGWSGTPLPRHMLQYINLLCQHTYSLVIKNLRDASIIQIRPLNSCLLRLDFICHPFVMLLKPNTRHLFNFQWLLEEHTLCCPCSSERASRASSGACCGNTLIPQSSGCSKEARSWCGKRQPSCSELAPSNCSWERPFHRATAESLVTGLALQCYSSGVRSQPHKAEEKNSN